jgi:hypothetical protein
MKIKNKNLKNARAERRGRLKKRELIAGIVR